MATLKRKALAVAPDRVNATAEALYLSQVTDHLTEIQQDTAELDSALFGDGGYVAIRAKAAALRPSIVAMTQWNPSDPSNPMEQAVREAHGMSGGVAPPKMVDAIRDAIFLSVHSATPEIANEARMGRDDKGALNVKPNYKEIVPQTYGSDKARFNIKDAAEAKRARDKRAADAASIFKAMSVPSEAALPGDKAAYRDARDMNTLWAKTVATGETIEGLRWLRQQMTQLANQNTRWRKRLYVDVVADRLATYTGNVGEVFEGTIGAAIAAHKAWVATQYKGMDTEEKKASVYADLPQRADDLASAMRQAVEDYLSPKETGEKAAASPLNFVLSKKLFDAARRAERHFKAKGLVKILRAATRQFNDLGLVDYKETEADRAEATMLNNVIAERTTTAAKAATHDATATKDAEVRQALRDKAAADKAAKDAAKATPVKADKAGKAGKAKPPVAVAPVAVAPSAIDKLRNLNARTRKK